MDCMYVNVKENMVSVKKAVYVALGIDIEGNKEVIDFWVGDSELSSFWYGILDELNERGVKDILYLSSDGVAGFKEILEGKHDNIPESYFLNAGNIDDVIERYNG